MSIPEFSRAAVLVAYQQPIQIQEIPVPQELEPGAILVKIERASLCGTDVHQWNGTLGKLHFIDLPVVMGHEMVGRVVSFGGDQERDSIGTPLSVGDRIIWTHGTCGQCYQCVVARKDSLCPDRKVYMFGNTRKFPYLTGGFSEYCYVHPTSKRVKVPDGVTSDWASAASCALRTVMMAFDRLGAITHTQSLIIQGDGPLGLFATAVAATRGPKRIIMIGGSKKRLDLAGEWGADEIISIAEARDPDERLQQILDLTEGRGGDIVFEFAGTADSFKEGLDMIAPGGRFIVVGQLGGHETTIMPTIITKKHIDIRGSYSAYVRHYYQALEFIDTYRGRFNFDLLITGRYSLEEINTAIGNMARFEEIKAVLDIA